MTNMIGCMDVGYDADGRFLHFVKQPLRANPNPHLKTKGPWTFRISNKNVPEGSQITRVERGVPDADAMTIPLRVHTRNFGVIDTSAALEPMGEQQ